MIVFECNLRKNSAWRYSDLFYISSVSVFVLFSRWSIHRRIFRSFPWVVSILEHRQSVQHGSLTLTRPIITCSRTEVDKQRKRIPSIARSTELCKISKRYWRRVFQLRRPRWVRRPMKCLTERRHHSIRKLKNDTARTFYVHCVNREQPQENNAYRKSIVANGAKNTGDTWWTLSNSKTMISPTTKRKRIGRRFASRTDRVSTVGKLFYRNQMALHTYASANERIRCTSVRSWHLTFISFMISNVSAIALNSLLPP